MGDAVRLFPDTESLSRAAAAEVVAAAQAAAGEGRPFSLALSGGRTPRELYRLLAGEFRGAIDWSRVHLYFGDERYIPHDHPQSNYRMVQETLLDAVPVPAAQVFAMPTHFADPDEAARAYEAVLQRQFGGAPPVIDLVLLGMGADGHTASLFPGTPAPAEGSRCVVASQAPVEPVQRLSLTVPVLTAARRLLFLVTGADKNPVWRVIRDNPAEAVERYPAALVSSLANATWFLDEAASSG